MFQKNKKKIILGLCVIVALFFAFWYFGGEGNDGSMETYTVGYRDVAQSIQEAGIVESAEDAQLGFKTSGRIKTMQVQTGDVVSRGDVLAELDNAEAYADILSARADVQARAAELANTQRSATGGNGERLALVREQQDALVENARVRLMSEGLVVEPLRSSYTQTPPVLTGRYSGPEGRYKVIIDRGSQFYDYEIDLFELETIRDVEISDTTLTPFGSHGLFISFPDSIASYADTIWYVTIPNKQSSSYLTNYNAYQDALRAREVALENAIANDNNLDVSEAGLLKAQAALSRAEAMYANTVLRAPFSGVITKVDVSRGESVGASQPVISLISQEANQITMFIPEADISYLDIGDSARVVFDAFDDEEFDAEVTFITPTAETREGVPVFETTLAFTQDDERIRAGLSVDVEVFAERRENVLAVPSRAIVREEGGSFVRILNSEGMVELVSVQTGLRSSDGFIEITDGLQEGDRVVTFLSDALRGELNDQ